MSKSEASKQKLELWKGRLSYHTTAFEEETKEMNARELIYKGTHSVTELVEDDTVEETKHVRNISSELIDSQVNSTIPPPKVQARRKKDETLAKLIEDKLLNEIDRLPFEELNDMQERTVPIQGGSCYLVEWDNFLRTHTTIGELVVSMLHPKELCPQEGVFRSIEDMDFMIIKWPQTKKWIERRFKVTLTTDSEEEPEVKSVTDSAPAKDMVTMYIGFYKNDDGGIGKFSWVRDTILEDYDDYQSRRLRHCKQCGAPEAPDDVTPTAPTMDGTWPGGTGSQLLGTDKSLPPELQNIAAPLPPSKPKASSGPNTCKHCGGTGFVDTTEDFEELLEDITKTDGTIIPKGTKVPYYKPNLYPVTLQKNVSVYGQLLGESDIDKIADQQNTTNRVTEKVVQKIFGGGSVMTRPSDATLSTDNKEMRTYIVDDVSKMELFHVFSMEGDITQDRLLREDIYQEARQIIGITDSYQGRTDPSAVSGKAREIATAQSAGRLESKRIMKNAAFARLYEIMFKFILAYSDEKRPVVSKSFKGETQYGDFYKYDFLEQDDAGEWYWNDQFLFSCDSTTLGSNREAMWQETRANLQAGTFGSPQDPQTLVMYWSKMEQLHYPGASETKAFLEDILSGQIAQMQQQMQQQDAIIKQQDELLKKYSNPLGGGTAQGGGVPGDRASQIRGKAKEDALNAAMAAQQGTGQGTQGGATTAPPSA